MKILLGCMMWCEHYSLYAITKQEAFCVPWSLSLFLACSRALSLSLSLSLACPENVSHSLEERANELLPTLFRVGHAGRPAAQKDTRSIARTYRTPHRCRRRRCHRHRRRRHRRRRHRRRHGRRDLRIYACTRVRARSARRGARRLVFAARSRDFGRISILKIPLSVDISMLMK